MSQEETIQNLSYLNDNSVDIVQILISEINRQKTLPAFNQAVVNTMISLIRGISESIRSLTNTFSNLRSKMDLLPPGDYRDKVAAVAAQFANELTFLSNRNKHCFRALHIYFQQRMEKLELLRIGGFNVLSTNMRKRLTPMEISYFERFRDIINDYTSFFPDFPIWKNHHAPTSETINVQAPEDLGSLYLESEEYLFDKDLRHNLSRDLVETLCLQGKLKHL
ncbi:hypothetical protein PCE1_004326 [Barthelona sp. PCE]